MSEVLFERARAGVAAVFSSHQLELVERLCDRVAIVKDGRIVAAGTVNELRAERSARLVRVDVEDDADGWYGDLSGFELVTRDREGLVFELAEGSDDQDLLEAARRAGRVRRFAPVEPSLAQLFREVVEL